MKHQNKQDRGALTMRPTVLSLEAHRFLHLHERLLAFAHGHVVWGSLEPHVRTYARRQQFHPWRKEGAA